MSHHDQLLEGLNPEQQACVLHDKGPLYVNAVAGCGKTRSVVHRIAYLHLVRGVPAERILAFTFTKKAAMEMSTRLAVLVGHDRCEIRTFHSLCRLILQEDQYGFSSWKLDEGGAVYEGIIKDAVGYQHLKLQTPDVALIQKYIGLCKAEMALPGSEESIRIAAVVRRGNMMTAGDLVSAYDVAENLRKESRVVTFDDWLVDAVLLFDEDETVRRRWASKFDFVLQDEVQDQSFAQVRLARHFAKDSKNYMVVGDHQQSVFSFRGARPDLMLSFPKEWQGSSVVMDRNYRSATAIVALANKVASGLESPVLLKSERPEQGKVTITGYDTQEEEAERTVQQIIESHEGGEPWANHCVLYRTNSLSRAVEEVLAKQKVPYLVIGGVPFYERREAKDLLTYARVASRRGSIKEMRRSLNRPNRFLSKKFLDAFEQELNGNPVNMEEVVYTAAHAAGLRPHQRRSVEQWLDTMRLIRSEIDHGATPDRIMQMIVDETRYNDWIREEEGRETIEHDRISNVAELVRAASLFATTDEFLDHVDRSIEASRKAAKDTGGDKVLLMSIHRAKALEWNHVYVITCNEGVIPHVRGEPLEERRVFYVAVTRARDTLTISWVRQAVSGGKVRELFPSSLLDVRRCGPEKEDELLDLPDLGETPEAPKNIVYLKDEIERRKGATS